MAVNKTERHLMANTKAPAWPAAPFDPARAHVHYNPLADEVAVRFDDEPVETVVDWIGAPDVPDAAVLVATEAENGRDHVVGVQVDLLLARAAKARPAWRILAEPDPPAEAVARLVRDVKALFDRRHGDAASG